MTEEQRLIHEEIEIQMRTWAHQFIYQRKRALQAGRKGVATGATLSSFEADIDRTAREEGIALVLAFNDAARFLDIKPENFQHDVWGRNAIERLEKWIQKRGLGNFLPNYLKKNPNVGFRKGLNLNKIIHDIAWGIAINRTKGKFKRKKVWNAAKTAGVFELINNVAASMPDPVLEGIKKNFDFKKYAKAKGR